MVVPHLIQMKRECYFHLPELITQGIFADELTTDQAQTMINRFSDLLPCDSPQGWRLRAACFYIRNGCGHRLKKLLLEECEDDPLPRN